MAGELLNVKVRRDVQGARVLALTGEIDLSTAPQVEKVISTELENLGGKVFVVDLTGVAFLASAGMATLIGTRESASRKGSDFRLVVAPNGAAHRSLEIAGLLTILPVYPTLDAATGEN